MCIDDAQSIQAHVGQFKKNGRATEYCHLSLDPEDLEQYGLIATAGPSEYFNFNIGLPRD